MNKNFNVYIVLRFLIGGVFLISGGEKLLSPYQNFLYVIQGYEFLPYRLEVFAARTVPWVELFLGLFVILGLWLKSSLRGLLLLILTLIIIVAQALIRELPIYECGCFGGLVSLTLNWIILMDSGFLALIGLLLYREEKTSLLSLDHYFQGQGK